MTRFFIALYRYFSTHKSVFYSILIATTVIFAIFAAKLHFEENILSLLPKTDKNKECAVAFSNVKVKDKLFVEVYSPDATPQQLEEEMESFLEKLSRKDKDTLIGNVLYKFDTDDIMNVVYYLMDALPCHIDKDLYPLLDSLSNEESIERMIGGDLPIDLSAASGYAIIDGYLFSPDSTLALAFITPAFDAMESLKSHRLERILAESSKECSNEFPGSEVLYHGTVVESCFNATRIRKDLIWTVGISLLLVCLIIGICFKSKSTLVHLLSPIIYGTLFGMACMYLIKGSMSLIALGIGAIVLGVALSYCLHVLTHYKFVSDVETVVKEQARPVCLGCLTTIGAFAGLLFTSSELLKDFGLFASCALAGTTFFALAFLPQFLKQGRTERSEKAFEIINKINSYPLDRNIPVVALLAVITIISLFFSNKVQFDSDLSNIGYREPKVVRSEEMYNTRVNKSNSSWYYAAHADNLDSAIVYNLKLAGKLDSLKNEGLITAYSGIKGLLIPFDQQEENIRAWKEYWTEEKTENALDLLLKMDEKYSLSTTSGFDIPGTFKLMTEVDFEPVSLYDYGALPESLLCNYVEHNDDGWLVFTNVFMDRENLRKVDDILTAEEHIVVLDPFYYTGDMVEIIHDDFNVVLWISSLFVLLVLLLSFRSITLSIIAFLPMALSWYIVQGLMAIFGIQFNLVNIMISTFIFGIGVDYSIFVMDGLICKEKLHSHRLLVFHKAAISFSAMTLLIVTGSLLFATHPAIYSIGISTIIGMTSTILLTYALEPFLFRLVMKVPFLRKRALHEK